MLTSIITSFHHLIENFWKFHLSLIFFLRRCSVTECFDLTVLALSLFLPSASTKFTPDNWQDHNNSNITSNSYEKTKTNPLLASKNSREKGNNIKNMHKCTFDVIIGRWGIFLGNKIFILLFFLFLMALSWFHIFFFFKIQYFSLFYAQIQ